MQITFLGQAGLFIETKHGTILCDPWFNPAYFASWFPFPSNENVDIEKLRCPDYLYLSHSHHDHFDPEFLRDHVWKEATILLPDFPLNILERGLRDIGFTKFIYTKNCQTVEINGLRITIVAMVAPIDGPLGFLDQELFQFNDFDRDPTNTFPDQTVFIEYMQERGYDNGRLMIPGSIAALRNGSCAVNHPLPDEQVKAIFTEKRSYLEAYQQRK